MSNKYRIAPRPAPAEQNQPSMQEFAAAERAKQLDRIKRESERAAKAKKHYG
jgi:hypothetical protein